MSPPDNPKRQAILQAAKQSFLAHGYQGASMDAIAEAAPVSKPTLYNHFSGKQELFAAVIAQQCEALLGALAEARTEFDDPEAGLKAIAGAFVDLVFSDEALRLYRLIIAEQRQFPELGELVYRTGPEPVLRQVSSYLSELDARGKLRVADVETSSRLLLGMLKGEPHFRCLLGLQAGLDESARHGLIDSAVSLFLRGHGHEG